MRIDEPVDVIQRIVRVYIPRGKLYTYYIAAV